MRAATFLLSVIVLIPWFRSSESLSLLGRKSTARQVHSYLQQNDQLAPFVSANGGGGGTAVVTGGNSGIGAETVKVLVGSGMKIVLCARNVESAASVKESLPECQQERVEIQKMDLSNLTSVHEAAGSILSKHKKVDCLINNAGIMALQKREKTTDGIEMQFGTNHVGHHFFTRLLLPQMNENGRIVTVASTAHTMAKTPIDDWESKESYSPWGAYGRSKLSSILFASQLQKELHQSYNDKNIVSVSLHPGVIYSPLWKHSLPRLLQPVVVRLIANKSIEQGAATSVYCALARHLEKGAYYDDCAVAKPSDIALSAKNQEKLWKYTEDLLSEKGFKLPAFESSASALAE